jgi:hypothetical protein
VKYDDVAAIFLQPLAEPIPDPDVAATDARRLRDALEPIATQGWWSPQSGQRFDALGLDFFPGYVWGRAAALGTPCAAVVVSTFGVFEPAFLGSVYEAGVAQASRADVLEARAAGAAAGLDSIATADECAKIADPLLRVLDGLDGLGRPLFNALRDLPVPTSPGGRLWRAAELVREHRGDGHLAALVGAGLGAAEANVLTERWLGFSFGEYSSTRGFGLDALEEAASRLRQRGWMDGHELTDVGRAARDAIEQATDASQAALADGCGTDIEEIIGSAMAISKRLVDAASFPPDPRKRAGG